MTLIKCKDCKKKIYSDSSFCPHCGVHKPKLSFEQEKRINEIKKEEEKLVSKINY